MPISPMELEASSDHGDNRSRASSDTSSVDESPLHRRRRINRRRLGSFEIEDEEFEEALGLLGHPIANHTDFEEETPQGRKNSARAWIWWILTMGLVAVFSRVLHHKENQWQITHGDERLPPVYECSAVTDENHADKASPATDTDTLSGAEFSYEQLKENLKDWTAQQVAPHLLQPQDSGVVNRVSILESSSRTLGLTLYLTLELLEEMQSGDENPTQFWVYGNDRDPFRASFSFFRQEEKLQKIPNVELGILCAEENAPLTDLSYIPADTFDMVFTGHLPPLSDPLEIGTTVEERTTRYQELCASEERNEQGELLRDAAQKAQEAWFTAWLGDMARVVRPGGLLLLENLSGPYCEGFHDGGGVAREWWATAVDEQKEWEVAPASLFIGDDHLREWRYHVAMKRKEKAQDTKAPGGGRGGAV